MSMENAPRNTIVFRMRALSICLFSLLLIPNALALTGCERGKNKSTSEQESPTKGAIAIREVQVTSSPTAPPPELVPAPQDLRERAVKSLDAGGYSRVGDAAPAESNLAIEYGSRRLEPANETPKLMLSISAKLSTKSYNARYERIHLIDDLDTVSKEAQRDAFLERFDSLTLAVQQDLKMNAIKSDALFDILSKESLQPEPTSTALRRLRTHIATDHARDKEALAIARKSLTSEDPRVVVSAAGLAAALGSKDLSKEIVDAATRMSQGNQPQAYIALLAQMGEVGGTEVEQYLETVASGHPMPQIQQIARDALERAKNSNKGTP